MATGLATRCPACGTVFRVVPDQLRVSEGWVRCGRCSDVFNAAEALVDLETGATRRMSSDVPGAGSPAPAPAFHAAAEPEPEFPAEPDAVVIEDYDIRALRDAPEPAPRQAPAPAQAPPEDSVLPVIDSTESRFAADATEAFSTTTAASEQDPAAAQTPSFVRRAERAQRWRQPRVRAALVALGVLATLTLAAQAAYEYRDLIAARHAATRPLLAAACSWLGCSVGAAHAIDSLTLESSGLVRVEKSALYRLQVALRNRATIDVALPALDLTLTDAQGKLLARRVLRPAELGATVPTLAAGRDLALQATLQAGFGAGETVAGYTIELFYP